MKELAFKWALKNAVDHDGKAVLSAVLSRILAEAPEQKTRIAELRIEVEKVVEEVNSLSLDEQRSKLEEYPELLQRKKIEKEKALPPLPKAEIGKVVTRLPPEPSGFMHIGHAMSGIINYQYARIYEGVLWLRFEDTDPRKVKPEYYDNFRRGYRWLGISWNREKSNSEDIELCYKHAEILIQKESAYVCTCSSDVIHRNRKMEEECTHRSHSTTENLELWNRMLSGAYPEGIAVLRLRGNMRSSNAVMRDPTLFRVVTSPHPMVGRQFYVWPTYDFAVAVEDALCGVTHVIRSSEFALRGELQDRIRSLLGYDNPFYVEYSRFEFKGTPVQKRKLRPLVDSGLVWGWDDPRLPTIDGVKRRGIVPESITRFTLTHTAMTFAKHEYTWDLLEAVNRSIIEPTSRRYFFVPDPVPVEVRGAPHVEVNLPHHPEKDLGSRSVKTQGSFYLSKLDEDKFTEGKTIRLKHLYNIEIERVGKESLEAQFAGRQLVEGVPILQWVTSENVSVRVNAPSSLYIDDSLNSESMKVVEGYGEAACDKLEVDAIIQFERFGFCRLDSKGPQLSFIFCHR